MYQKSNIFPKDRPAVSVEDIKTQIIIIIIIMLSEVSVNWCRRVGF